MEATVDSLASSLLRRLDTAAPSERVLVGLCGIPGSGKSQLGLHVVQRCNVSAGRDVAILVGMDGWHLTRAQLDAMDDPQLARERRGAAWTFDDKAFADFVEGLRSTAAEHTAKNSASASTSRSLCAPSFSHAKKDPVADDICIEPHHQIVVFEGLYANVDEGEWRRAAQTYDERWVVDCPERTARSRLVRRHIETGVAKDEAEAEWRADNNDLPNGRYLLQHVLEPAHRIISIDDDDFREEA